MTHKKLLLQTGGKNSYLPLVFEYLSRLLKKLLQMEKNNIEKTAPNGKKAIEKTAQYVIIMKKGACLDV